MIEKVQNVKGDEVMINVTKSSMPTYEEYCEEIKDMWESRWLTNMGSKHRELQEELKKYLKVSMIDLFTNGHMALELSLQALNLEGEVITTPFTFASTTHAIVRNGLCPVFCDISQEDFTIDVTQIENLITERTCAIVPVHVYGNICDVEVIEKIARKYNLKVVYDAAHAFGVTYKGQGVGCFGDVSCFSFHATKVFHTIEGGAACFHDEAFGLDLYRLKNFGIRGPEEVDAVGANAKMNEFCAAMGICNLRHIEADINSRKRVVEHYRNRLAGVPGIRLSKPQRDVETNYAYFPVLFDPKLFGADRDVVFAKLGENGIVARKYFYPLTSAFACYSEKYKGNKTPIAEAVARSVLTLPLYPELEEESVNRICDIILSCRN